MLGYEENGPSIVPKVEMPSSDISMVTGRSEVEESMPVVYETGSTLPTSKRSASKRRLVTFLSDLTVFLSRTCKVTSNFNCKMKRGKNLPNLVSKDIFMGE